MAVETDEQDLYVKRMRTLQKQMGHGGFDAALIMQPRDLFYYAGTAQPANLWIPVAGEPILFTRRAHALARGATWIRRTVEGNSYADLRRSLTEIGALPKGGAVLGVELDVVPAALVNSLARHFADVTLKNVSPLIVRQRFVKDPAEVARIREAVEAWEEGHRQVLSRLVPGRAEYEIAAAMEYGVRNAGGDGVVWFRRWDGCLPGGGIVSSGPNAWVVSGHAMTVTGVGMNQGLPWGASDRRVERGDLVVVDYGVTKGAYHADMARTYCVGKPSTKQQGLWDRLIELHHTVIERIRPGVTGEELYRIGAEAADKMGMTEYFMGVGADRGTYIGHSIGLEVDDWPVLGEGSRDPLVPGAVVTIEPKFMIPGLGAVMVEDDILVTEEGHEMVSTLGHELFYV
ncbi:MAG: Xaa-Pro peptidase family protein [Kyrpidia sp.]|nr:Xaa-Pro peptidase family protein [Kyrpidia sp.]